jgi:multicomponent Na+:H+ antiporter subunit D
VAVLLISSLLNAGYFLPIVINAFFRDEKEAFHSHEGAMEAPGIMLIPVVMIVMLTLVFGLLPEIPLWLVDQSIALMGVGK